MEVKRQQLEPDMKQQTGNFPNFPISLSNWERSMSRLYIVTWLFKFYMQYIMQNARLDQAQTGIKIAGKNINNLR